MLTLDPSAHQPRFQWVDPCSRYRQATPRTLSPLFRPAFTPPLSASTLPALAAARPSSSPGSSKRPGINFRLPSHHNTHPSLPVWHPGSAGLPHPREMVRSCPNQSNSGALTSALSESIHRLILSSPLSRVPFRQQFNSSSPLSLATSHPQPSHLHIDCV